MVTRSRMKRSGKGRNKPERLKRDKPVTIPMIEIERLNRENGGSWFSPDNIRFFNSRYGGSAVLSRDGKTAYFVSSEKRRGDDRRYTIRKVNMDSGDIGKVGEFQEFSTKSKAEKKLKELV